MLDNGILVRTVHSDVNYTELHLVLGSGGD